MTILKTSLSDEVIRELVMDQIRVEEKGFCKQEEFQPLFYWRGMERFIRKEPPKAEYVFTDYLRHKMIGSIFATGGTGKTFLIIELAAALATGITFGPFQPTKPRKILFLAGEEDENLLWERARAIFSKLEIMGEGALAEYYEQLLIKNLEIISLRGTPDKLFFEYEPNTRNVKKTAFFQNLKKTLIGIGDIEVLFIDPLSRFFGLDENNSKDANEWIAAMEELSKDLGATILYSHHENKTQAQSGELKNSYGRGSTAFRDGVRWSISLAEMDSKQAQELGVNHRDYVIADVTKSNHTKKLPGTIYFKRDPDTGVLLPVELKKDVAIKQAEILAEAISSCETELTRTELTTNKSKDKNKKMAIDEIRATIQEKLPFIKLNNSISNIIDAAICFQFIRTEKKISGKKSFDILVVNETQKVQNESKRKTLFRFENHPEGTTC